MDEQLLRRAYTKTALFRLGIAFERAVQSELVRRALEGSALRSKPQAVQPAMTAAGR